MLFRKQRNMTVMFGRDGWLRPDMPVPNGDTVISGDREELEGAPAEQCGIWTRSSLLIRV